MTVEPNDEVEDAPEIAKGTPEWQIFETDVAAFVASSDPNATVEHNVEVSGVLSKRMRQVDVMVSGTVGVSKLEVAIECKRNTKSAIGIGVVDEFFGKLHDLGVDRGVLYAFGTFDKGAIARAAGSKSPKIELRNLEHPEELPDWSDLIPEFLGVSCPVSDCWGEVLFGEYVDQDGNPLNVGYCSNCGTPSMECPNCDEVVLLDASHVTCFGCGASHDVIEETDGSGISTVIVGEPIED